MLHSCMFFYAHKIKFRKSRNGAGLDLVVPVSSDGNSNFEERSIGSPRSPSCSSKRLTLKDLFIKDLSSASSSSSSSTSSAPSSPCAAVNPASASDAALIRKINFCKAMAEPISLLKRKSLEDILRVVMVRQGQLSSPVLTELFSMMSINLGSRGFPVPRNQVSQEEDLEDESFCDPYWPHLEIVYKILLNLVAMNDPRFLAKDPSCLHKPFILVLLDCFQSEDQRERTMVKSVFHRIYDKFVFFRNFMRNSVKNVLLGVVYERGDDHPGIGEILEFVESVVNGMALPVKEEHKAFLKNVLMPLHRPSNMPAYHSQLQSCICQFLQKDDKLISMVIRVLLTFWPVTNSQKEILLMEELEEVLALADEAEFRKSAGPLSSRLFKCLRSENLQVAEKALSMWNDPHFVSLLSMQMEHIMPQLVEAVEGNIKTHWSDSIRHQSLCLKTILLNMNPELYQKGLLQLQDKVSQAEHKRQRRNMMWEMLEKMANENTQGGGNAKQELNHGVDATLTQTLTD